MFDRIIENLYNGTGAIIEHEGKKYVQVDQNSWKSNIGWVTCKLVIPAEEGFHSWDASVMVDIKALISIKPEGK